MHQDIEIEKHRKNNSLFAYITSFFSGFSFPIAGILSPQIASELHVPTTKIVFTDSSFLAGIIIGSGLSGKILEKIGAVKSIIIAISILMCVNFGFALQSNVFIYAPLVLLNGIAMGLLIASVNFLIISSFNGCGNLGDSKLNITQFFVGIGAFTGTYTAGQLAFYFSWRLVFATAAIFFLLIIMLYKSLNISCQKNKIATQPTIQSDKKNKPIPLYIFMIGFAMISYVYTEYIISYWFSPFLQEDINLDVASVGNLISMFWLLQAFGRLILGKYVLPKVSDYYLIITLSCITILGFICFILNINLLTMYISIFILGLGCSGIFPTLLAFGMKLSGQLSTYTKNDLVFENCCFVLNSK